MILIVAAMCLHRADAGAHESVATVRWALAVKETAGIRRFSYPVTAIVNLDQADVDTASFRLLENGKPVNAQFRIMAGTRNLHVDFTASNAPLETRNYVVEYDADRRTPPSTRGLRVLQESDTVRIAHPSDLEFVVPRNLVGLLRQARTKRNEYVRAESAGLKLRCNNASEIPLTGLNRDGTSATIKTVKDGPQCVLLRMESDEKLPGGRRANSMVELEFPLSKSWVCVSWSIKDAGNVVSGLGVDLNLNVTGDSTLIDFGADALVYARLRKGEAAALKQENNRWGTLLGRTNALTPFVVAATAPAYAQGWAHVMDAQRCTALAVDEFRSGGEISIHADGRVQIWRTNARSLRVWLHFVGMPVHVGAATSPQAMLAPLSVEVQTQK